jgi:hypothetical protein
VKVVWIVLLILLLASLIGWVRGDAVFPIVQALPFLGGYSPGIYDAGACIMILITVWGIRRLNRRNEDK